MIIHPTHLYYACVRLSAHDVRTVELVSRTDAEAYAEAASLGDAFIVRRIDGKPMSDNLTPVSAAAAIREIADRKRAR